MYIFINLQNSHLFNAKQRKKINLAQIIVQRINKHSQHATEPLTLSIENIHFLATRATKWQCFQHQLPTPSITGPEHHTFSRQ